MEAKVIGIAGIFFVAKDPVALKKWYQKHLGITGQFHWSTVEDRTPATTEWNIFSKGEGIFAGYDKDYIYSYYVNDLTALIAKLKESGTQPSSTTTDSAIIHDPDGNKVILKHLKPSPSQKQASPAIALATAGGLFFKTPSPSPLKDWYRDHLGFDVKQWGCSFDYIDPTEPSSAEPASLAWNPFPATTDYFKPSEKDFMLNYRVRNFDALLAALKAGGVELAGEPQDSEYGKFGWILDPEGNKVELWAAS